MVNPSWEEMEEKRQQMVKSLHTMAAAMAHASSLIEDYANLSNPLTKDHVAPASGSPEPVAGKKRKVKAPKDPNAPKRPASAYFLWQNEVRAKFKAENEGMPNAAVMGLMSESWKEMTDEQKKPFHDKFADLKATFETDKDAYNASGASAVATNGEPPAKKAKAAPKEKAKGKDKAPVAAPVAAPVEDSDEDESEAEAAVPAVEAESDDSDTEDDDEDDSDSEESEAPAPVPVPAPAPPAKKAKAAPKAAKAPVAEVEKPKKAKKVKA